MANRWLNVLAALRGRGGADLPPTSSDDYFSNHGRQERFPWTLYHNSLTASIAQVISEHGPRARVLMVGCGLEASIPGIPRTVNVYGCDIDARAVQECRKRYADRAGRFAVCPGPYELPHGEGFDEPFDVVLAKEVVEHTLEPERWAGELSARVRVGGHLVLTTPNYGRWSTLPVLERTVLEWIARRDGFSRRHIHPTRFDRRRLAALDVGGNMRLVGVSAAPVTHWALVGTWTRDR